MLTYEIMIKVAACPFMHMSWKIHNFFTFGIPHTVDVFFPDSGHIIGWYDHSNTYCASNTPVSTKENYHAKTTKNTRRKSLASARSRDSHSRCSHCDSGCDVDLASMKYLLDDLRQAWRYRNAPQPQRTPDSEQYQHTHMAGVPSYRSDLRLHRAVSPLVLQGGLILEFGVARGRSIRHWAGIFPTHDIYGFDGFEGIYEPWNGLPAGHFAQDPPSVPDNVHLVVGRFDQTLDTWAATHPGFISLLHIDCDLYSATRDVFRVLRNRIQPGTIIVFDEYWNYPGWQQHEFRAWQEQRIPYRYIGHVHGGNYQPVAVQVTE
jgi:hypothetical protein